MPRGPIACSRGFRGKTRRYKRNEKNGETTDGERKQERASHDPRVFSQGGRQAEDQNRRRPWDNPRPFFTLLLHLRGRFYESFISARGIGIIIKKR